MCMQSNFIRETLKNNNIVKAADIPNKAPRARIAALFLSRQLHNRLHSQAARHQFDFILKIGK